MARKTLYQRLDGLGVNIAAEYDALIRLFKAEANFFSQYTHRPLISYINNEYFRDLPADFRSPFLSVEEMMCALELWDTSNSLDDLFLLSELLIALLPEEHIIKKQDLYRQANTIFENIFSFLEKLNYEVKEIGGGRKIIVQKNSATTQAVEIVTDNSTAFALIEYNHYALKGDLDAKRRILNALGSYIEPVLKSRTLQNAGYKQLESDVGFMLNDFHVRHNNKEGAKKQDYIVSLSNEQLEEWYDKIYNAILSVIIINEHILTQHAVAELKQKYIWRT